jgi:hypothetical protein
MAECFVVGNRGRPTPSLRVTPPEVPPPGWQRERVKEKKLRKACQKDSVDALAAIYSMTETSVVWAIFTGSFC